jgi:hypothetical protein
MAVRARFFLALLIAACSHAHAVTLYKLIDRNGAVTYVGSVPAAFDGKVIALDIDPDVHGVVLTPPKSNEPEAKPESPQAKPIDYLSQRRARWAEVEARLKSARQRLDDARLAEFLERGYLRAHLARILPEYKERRDALEAGLAAHLPDGIRWRRSGGGLHLWLLLPATYNPEEVADEARRRGVVVTPSTLYALEPREHPGLRLTFCTEPPERLSEFSSHLLLWDKIQRVVLRDPFGFCS